MANSSHANVRAFLSKALNQFSVKSYIKLLLVLATYVLLFSTVPKIGNIVQVFALFLLGLAALLSKRLPAIRANSRVINPLIAVICLMCVFSYMAGGIAAADSGITQNIYTLVFTTVLLLTTVSLNVIAKVLRLKDILNVAFAAFVLVTASVLVLQGRVLVFGLGASSALSYVLRFSPFGIQPNLVGVMFAIGLIAAQHKFLAEAGWRRVLPLIIAMACFLIMLAASARGSLVAYGLSTLIVIAVGYRNFRPSEKKVIHYTFLSMGAIFLLAASKIIALIRVFLAIDSATRGLNSGGSGRVDLWLHGLEYIFSDPFRPFVGNGIRSALNFSTENSYINVCIDSGVIVGGIFFALLIYLLAGLLRKFRGSPTEGCGFATSFILFMLIESFFNRYLLAIGNPTSILFLLTMCVVSRQSYMVLFHPDPDGDRDPVRTAKAGTDPNGVMGGGRSPFGMAGR